MFLQEQTLISFFKRHLNYYPSASNLSYFFGFGSLAGITLGLQIASGVFVAMHYQVGADTAFASVEHLCRDVPNG